MLQKTLYATMQNLVNTYATLMFDKNVAWHEPLPEGAKILAVNHPSTIDPVMLTTLIPEHVNIMISETLFKVPVLGSWLKNSGHINVIHARGQSAVDEAVKVLESNQTVAIFPEGAISPIGGFHKGHRGVARLALLTGAPIIPIGIHLAPEHITQIETKVAGKREVGTWYFHGPYAMTVGNALHVKGDAHDRDVTLDIAEEVMRRIQLLSLESHLRIRSQRSTKPTAQLSLGSAK